MFWPRIQISTKKSKFWQRIQISKKKSNFWQRIQISKKIQFLAKNSNFEKKSNLDKNPKKNVNKNF